VKLRPEAFARSSDRPSLDALEASLTGISDLAEHGDQHGSCRLAASLGPAIFRSAHEDAAAQVLALVRAMRPTTDRYEAMWWAQATLEAGNTSSAQQPPEDTAPDPPGGSLTPREIEVVQLMATGCTNKDIARQLAVSPKTIMHHAASIYRKLDVHGRAGAVAVWQGFRNAMAVGRQR
jgi:DNA-binding NarL/FixJ family response regulator